MTVTDPSAGVEAGLPVRRVSMSQLVAYNMAAYRKAAGLSQQELGERLGWSAASVSQAERSWNSKRIKKFDVDELVQIAAALAVPLTALLWPPEDDGTAVRYVLDMPGLDDRPLRDLLPIDLGTLEPGSPAMTAYRKRLIAAGVMPPDKPLDEPLETVAAVLAKALQVADEVIVAARNDSDGTLTRARGEAEQVLDIAKKMAEQIVRDTRERIENLERDAEQRHREAIGDLPRQRGELERRIDDLRVFEREYRSRLRQFLESSYRDFMADVQGIDAEQLLEAMRQQASERGAETVTALLLGDDGAYKVYTLDQVAEIAEIQSGEAYGDRVPEEGEVGTTGEDDGR